MQAERPQADTPPQTPSGTAGRPSVLRRVGKALGWLVGSVVGLIALGLLALWLWAATPGSLSRTLGWAQTWLNKQEPAVGRLSTEGVEGSLRLGGGIAQLSWEQAGLTVTAKGVRLAWGDALWTHLLLGRGVQLDQVTVEQLTVHDERPATPTEPMQALVLPIPVAVGFGVDQFKLTGKTELALSELKGDYQYGPIGSQGDAPALPASAGLSESHQLRIDSLRMAQGLYEGKLSLGAQAPMPLAMALVGNIQTEVPDGARVQLKLHAQANGTLSGAEAAIDVDAEAEGTSEGPKPQASTLALQARVMPWAKQPLISAKGDARSLNLAALWPDAPATDLSGTVAAQPEANSRWLAQIDLTNARPAPLDQQGLPLESLQASVAQQGDRWNIETVKAKLAGGALEGQGGFSLVSQDDRTAVANWQGELSAQGIQPDQVWSQLPPSALDASLSAKAEASSTTPDGVAIEASIQPAKVQPKGALTAGLKLSHLQVKGQWTPAASANPAAGMLQLKRAQLAIADALLDTQGRFDTEALSYEGNTTLQLPGGRIAVEGLLAHARGQGQGQVEVADAARLLAWVRDLEQVPLVGEAVRSTLAGQEALSLNGEAAAKVQWTGGLGALGWPRPTGPDGAATQAPGWPQVQMSLDMPRLTVQNGETADLAISQLKLAAKGSAQAMQINASGFATQGGWQAELDTRGDAKFSPRPPQAGQVQLTTFALRLRRVDSDGTTSSSGGWQVLGAQPLTLRWSQDSNNSLALDAGTGLLRLTALNSQQASNLTNPLSLAWERLAWQGGALDTQGRLEGLSIPWLEALAATAQEAQPERNTTNIQSGISGDLVFDGAWNMHLPTNAQSEIDLSATLQRRSGDLRWESGLATAAATTLPNANAIGSERITAGIQDARISLVIKDRKARAALRWDTERLGQAKAEVNTTLAPGGPGSPDGTLMDRWWPGNTPISGTAQASLPQVGVWSMLAPPGWRMRGTLNANATVSGTRDKPVWQGRIEANELALRSVVDGFAFTNGQLRASLAGDRLNVERFSLQGPGGEQSGGTLEASGQAEWLAQPGSNVHQPVIKLQAKAQRLRVSNRVDRRLALSGDVNAELTGDQLRLRGQLEVDSAQIILPDELAPSLSKDVVVRTTRTLPTESTANVVKPDVQLTLDLGQQFQVRGQGIDTRLVGQLTVRATPALPTPRATGEVRTVSGTYKAYGQQLNIETGVLRFTGPYDDPALDILAVRKLPENTDQRVGVQIKGNAQAPRVSLYSEPALTDGEALAWLVLGRPASAAGAQAFVLQQAARQLLARGGSTDEGTLAKTLGVDEVGFADAGGNADGTATQTALTVGKRLSDRLYLSYEQSLSGAMSTVSILYDLSKSLTLRARAGTENAIDLIFTHRYE